MRGRVKRNACAPIHAHPFFPQTAERTRDLAAATLDDLHDQGDQLARVQGDLNTV